MFDFLKRPGPTSRSRSPIRKSVASSESGDIFEKKRHISRQSLRRKVKESISGIPGGKKWYHQQGKDKGVVSSLFSEEKFGSFVGRRDFETRLRGLREERMRAKTFADKKDAIKRIALLKKLRER